MNAVERGTTAIVEKIALAFLMVAAAIATGTPAIASSDPTVTATSPAAGATGVPLSSQISATFSTDMKGSTIDAANFSIGGVAGTVSYDKKNDTATFTPNSPLAPNTTYSAEISHHVKSTSGKHLKNDSTWSFTTGAGAQITTLYSFNGASGADPKGSLTLVSVSGLTTLFGRTSAGGPAWESTNSKECKDASTNPSKCPGAGVIFRLSASSGGQFQMTPLTSTTGYQPHHDSMLLLNSTLYGAVLYSGNNFKDSSGNGGIFSLNPSSLSLTSLHQFAGATSDGANSHSCMWPASDGETIYGSTAAGCSSADDSSCSGSGDGTLYCYNTANDSSSACYDSSNSTPYLTMFSFLNGTGTSASSCKDCTGSEPHGRPVSVNVGTASSPTDILLGITRQGGLTTDGNKNGDGTVYAFAPGTGTYTVLHLFSGQDSSNLSASDGAYTDHGNLVIGNFVPASGSTPAQVTVYGMTTYGGSGTQASGSTNSPGSGVIFAMTVNLPAPTTTAPTVAGYQIIHNFGGSSVTNLATNTQQPDGFNPYGSLAIANGWLYGMTRDGGPNGGGVIFRMSPQSSCAGSSAASCYGLIAAFDSPTQGSTDLTGSQPIDNVIVSEDGSTLYGMTQMGGANDPTNQQQQVSFGTVFSIPANP